MVNSVEAKKNLAYTTTRIWMQDIIVFSILFLLFTERSHISTHYEQTESVDTGAEDPCYSVNEYEDAKRETEASFQSSEAGISDREDEMTLKETLQGNETA